MKKLIVTLAAMACAAAVSASAADGDKGKGKGKGGDRGKRPQLTEKQRELLKPLVEKYDANKNGRLDRSEFGAMSDDDKKKLREIRGAGRGKGKGGQRGKERPSQ